jgi:hypothetical protein
MFRYSKNCFQGGETSVVPCHVTTSRRALEPERAAACVLYHCLSTESDLAGAVATAQGASWEHYRQTCATRGAHQRHWSHTHTLARSLSLSLVCSGLRRSTGRREKTHTTLPRKSATTLKLGAFLLSKQNFTKSKMHPGFCWLQIFEVFR